MTKTITVNVTQEDIDHGVANNCFKCPIARAVERALPGSDPTVRNFVYLYGTHCGSADLPLKAGEFIDRFDNNESVSPLTFDLTFHEFRDFTNPSQPQA